MVCIPLFCVCGELPQTKSLGQVTQARDCPNCRIKGGTTLYESYSRFHFCFIPLCREGRSRHFRCSYCGATYPA